MGLNISLCAYGPSREVAVLGLISALDANNYKITDQEYLDPYVNIADHGKYEVTTRKLPGQFQGRELWEATLILKEPIVQQNLTS
jgi:hypothetical protein